MQTTLGILTALVLVASAFLGYKNKEKYELQISTRQKEEDLRDNKRKPKLKDTLQQRDDTKAEKEKYQGLAAAKGSEVEAQEKKVADLKKEIETKKALADEQKVKIDALNAELEKIGSLEELVAKVTRLKNDLIELESNIDVTTTKLSNLIAEKNRTATVIKGYEWENGWRNASMSSPNLKTRISAIFDSYGFVTLPVGNRAGVVGGSTLEIVRDNEVIGKLLVKSVEANTAAAEIVPNSIKADTVLMVGDSVRSTMPPPPPPPKKEATAPAGAPNAAPTTPAAEFDPLTGAPVIPPGGALVAPADPADADSPAAPADAATPKPAEDDPFK
jgi:hypothetical protein